MLRTRHFAHGLQPERASRAPADLLDLLDLLAAPVFLRAANPKSIIDWARLSYTELYNLDSIDRRMFHPQVGLYNLALLRLARDAQLGTSIPTPPLTAPLLRAGLIIATVTTGRGAPAPSVAEGSNTSPVTRVLQGQGAVQTYTCVLGYAHVHVYDTYIRTLIHIYFRSLSPNISVCL